MTKFSPYADKIVIKPDEAEKKSAGGILIPETAIDKPVTGVVVACGPGTQEERMQATIGDHVFYSKFSGTEIELDAEKFLVMRVEEVLTAYQP